jgi:hypothetical protein
VETASRGDAASFTHFHHDAGDPVPCIKTTIPDDQLVERT